MSPREEGPVPARWLLVSIVPKQDQAPVRLSVVVQRGTAGAAPSLILLRSSPLGRAYLGAIADTRDRPLTWLELWVQTSGDATAPDAIATNPELDVQWRRWAALMSGDDAVIATGWETAHAPPLWVDGEHGRSIEPRDNGAGEPFELCMDDAPLIAAGLEPFSTSTRRYLWVKDHPVAGFLSPVGDAPVGARPASAVLPAGAGLIPFNPEGGFVLARRLAPLEWENYAAWLSGATIRPSSAGAVTGSLGGAHVLREDWDTLQQSGAYLFSTTRGRAGRFHESFHLKLLLLHSMLRAVRARASALQLPQLNLDPAAFRVDLASDADAGALPILWTARATLAGPPGSVALSAADGLRYFRALADGGASVYRPREAGRAIHGHGELRIRKVFPTADRVQVEATIAAADIATASPRDVVSARLPLAGAGAVTLVGKIDATEALARGEARFRTVPFEAGPSVRSALSAAEGGVYPGTPFETMPLLSTPVDLFALGVLGVQLFVTGAGKPLPAAVDEVLSLVRAAAAATTGNVAERVRRVVVTDERWNASLGPQHHGHGATAEEAAAYLPAELWWDTVAVLSRFFCGASADAFCRDFGDAPAHEIEASFDSPLAAVDALVRRSQALLLCDWPSNREMARVIQACRAKAETAKS